MNSTAQVYAPGHLLKEGQHFVNHSTLIGFHYWADFAQHTGLPRTKDTVDDDAV